MSDSPQHSPISPQDRRDFLKTSGSLLLGFTMMQFPYCTPKGKSPALTTPIANTPLRPFAGPKAIDSWIRLDANGHVTVLTGKMELGQGVRTALMQMAAEELDIDIKRVGIITADTGQTPNERYTAGSASIESSGKSIRNAAAEARKRLMDMAAAKLHVQVSTLQVENGVVSVVGTKNAISYSELLQGKQIEGEVTGTAPLKDPSSYKLVGSPQPREDIIGMATGMPSYVHDVRLPGMIHGRILRPPSYEAKLKTFSTEQAANFPGVLKIVRNGSFVAVIAEQEYDAIKALAAIREMGVWEKKPISPLSNNLHDDMVRNGTSAEVVADHPTISNDLLSAAIHHEAIYKRPYHMHASIGPSCAVALFENDQLTIWSHTQGVYPLRQTISNLLSIPEEKIRVIGVPGSGCYGHNGADDVSADAALLAMEMQGKPVRVQWMREDEHCWEPYGTAMVMNVRAGVSTEGKVVAWKTELWSDTHSTRPGGKAGHFIAGRDLEKPFSFAAGGFSGGSSRNSVPLYEFPAKQILLHRYNGPLRTSALRSLGAYANIFALESFMDELALKTGKDPVEFRLSHLKDERAREVIKALANKTGWGNRKSKRGTGFGFAFAQYKNEAAYCAVVAEVTIDKPAKKINLIKLTGCIDAGQTINSDGIKNQTSGGMIQSASWTMTEQVDYNADGIQSYNWETYPILRFLDVPDTEVIIIDRPEQEPLGAGEAAQGPTGAAIANAIYAATGSRLRELPLTADKVDWNKL